MKGHEIHLEIEDDLYKKSVNANILILCHYEKGFETNVNKLLNSVKKKAANAVTIWQFHNFKFISTPFFNHG